ncbi:MAG: hypothetical protein E2598_07455 [Sphingobium sp.]|nr:hypothetical protein [Sphingobium sp.]
MSKAVFFRPLPMTIVSATGTVAGHDAAYLGNDHMGVVWRAVSDAGGNSIMIDMGADVAVDSAALICIDGAGVGWSVQVDGATSAQGPSFAGTNFTAGVIPQLSLLIGDAPVSGRGRGFYRRAGGPVVARYWRVLITAPSAGQTFSIARIALGCAFQPERNFDFGGAFGVRDSGTVDWSSRGVFLRRRGMKNRSTGLSFASLYKDEVKAAVQPMIERVGGTGPIVLVTDPDADDDLQNRIYFGPLVGDLGTIQAKASAGWQFQANIVDLESYAGDA